MPEGYDSCPNCKENSLETIITPPRRFNSKSLPNTPPLQKGQSARHKCVFGCGFISVATWNGREWIWDVHYPKKR